MTGKVGGRRTNSRGRTCTEGSAGRKFWETGDGAHEEGDEEEEEEEEDMPRRTGRRRGASPQRVQDATRTLDVDSSSVRSCSDPGLDPISPLNSILSYLPASRSQGRLQPHRSMAAHRHPSPPVRGSSKPISATLPLPQNRPLFSCTRRRPFQDTDRPNAIPRVPGY